MCPQCEFKCLYKDTTLISRNLFLVITEICAGFFYTFNIVRTNCFTFLCQTALKIVANKTCMPEQSLFQCSKRNICKIFFKNLTFCENKENLDQKKNSKKQKKEN